jgi:hypothetical protein
MKKIISKIIGLSHVSVLGGYLQFGLGYAPNWMFTKRESYSRFSASLGILTIEMFANSKSVNELNFSINGTSHKMEIKFDWKTFSHCYRKRVGGNSEYKSNLLYSWK